MFIFCHFNAYAFKCSTVNRKSFKRLELTFSELKADRNLVCIEIKQDGYCLVNSVQKCLQVQGSSISPSELKQQLRHELLNNSNCYRSFCIDKSSEEFIQQVNIDHGFYDSDVGDVITQAICNCLCINVVIYKQHDGSISEITCFPSQSEAKTTVTLVRYGQAPEHYDALVPVIQMYSVVADHPSSAASKATKRKMSQATIANMFAKKTTSTYVL